MDRRNVQLNQPQDEDIMDIPLDDPEANKAAAKIQASFRGHMTRKKMKDEKPREEWQRADAWDHERIYSRDILVVGNCIQYEPDLDHEMMLKRKQEQPLIKLPFGRRSGKEVAEEEEDATASS